MTIVIIIFNEYRTKRRTGKSYTHRWTIIRGRNFVFSYETCVQGIRTKRFRFRTETRDRKGLCVTGWCDGAMFIHPTPCWCTAKSSTYTRAPPPLRYQTLERGSFPPIRAFGSKNRCCTSGKVYLLLSTPCAPSKQNPITITNIVNRVVFTSLKNIRIIYDNHSTITTP